jgi:hypothetical protein
VSGGRRTTHFCKSVFSRSGLSTKNSLPSLHSDYTSYCYQPPRSLLKSVTWTLVREDIDKLMLLATQETLVDEFIDIAEGRNLRCDVTELIL